MPAAALQQRPAGLLERLLGAGGPSAMADATGPYGPLDDYWYQVIDKAAASGVSITPDSAMRQSAVFACVRVIAEDIGSAPLPLYRRRGSTAKERVGYNDMPLARIVGLQPNDDQTSMEWREMMTGHALLRGHGYSRIVAGPAGFVTQLVPLHPDRVKRQKLPNGAARYVVKDANNQEIAGSPFPAAEIFDLPGPFGLSVIALAREAIGSAIAAEQYGGRFLSRGMSPPGVLKHPGTLSPEAQKGLTKQFVAKYAGPNEAGTPLVLSEGMEWQQLGMTSDDAQWLETRKFELDEIARFFRMKPHKIGILDRATFSNIENESIAYVTDTIRPWAVRWEERMLMQIILRPDIFFFEFNLEGLLRGDVKSRYEAYQIARQNGAFSANEWRERENMNPVEGGDAMWMPVNMAVVSGAGGGAPPAAVAVPAQPAAGQRLAHLALELSTRLVRKEIDRVSHAARRHADDAEAWGAFLDDFYADYGAEVARTLGLPEESGRVYAKAQRDELDGDGGIAIMETWLERRPAELAAMATEGGA